MTWTAVLFCAWQRMVEKIKKQNEKADDLMEQQDDMIANYKVL